MDRPACLTHSRPAEANGFGANLVHDVAAATAFCTAHLGFALRQQFGPAMAIPGRDGLTLWLAGPMASAAKPSPAAARSWPGTRPATASSCSSRVEPPADLAHCAGGAA
jgi:hypothetical protein